MNPPTFLGDSNVSLHNSQVNSSRDVYFNITNRSQSSDNDPYRILENSAALDALFDSDARYDPPKCHPDTRTAILAHIREWASDPESLPIMWIRGGAGAGKSAIAQTLSEGWDDGGLLAASFYFSRTAPNRNIKKHIIATLAYQIATSIPSTRPLIEDVIRRVPGIFERNLRTQMKQLIVNPLVLVAQTESITPRIVVIDGLDECCVNYQHQDFEQQQKEILGSIHSVLEHSSVPLRFLIASRPERQIREIFDHGPLKHMSLRIALDNTYNPAADIELYLRSELAQLRRVHPHLEPSWPPESVISQLVEKSSGHFIYAAVVVRYLSSPRRDPDAGLKALLGLDSRASKGEPFAELDTLYNHILLSVAKESLPTVMDIFRIMLDDSDYWELVFFERSNDNRSPYFIAKYLFTSLGQLYLHLTDLHSILDIPRKEASCDAPIKFLHASFSEYLTQSHRSKDFHLDNASITRLAYSLSMQHLFIQVLSDDNGEGDDYVENGFAMLTSELLFDNKELDEDILQALKALVSQDETEFTRYVHHANLTCLGTTRRSLEVIRSLYHLHESEVYAFPLRPSVLEVLKVKYTITGFVPIDPAIFEPDKYRHALSWFCDTYEETTADSDTFDYSSSSDSDPPRVGNPELDNDVTVTSET